MKKILHYIEANIDRFPEKIALFQGDRKLTYCEMGIKVQRLVWILKQHGIKKGDKIAFIMRNSIEFALNYIATNYLRAVWVPINIRLNEKEISDIVGSSDTKFILCDNEFEIISLNLCQKNTTIQKYINVEAIILENELVDGGEENLNSDNETDTDRNLAIFYTSGTTGMPKGVVHSEHVWLQWLLLGALQFGISERDIVIIPFALSSAPGNYLLLMMLVLGGTCVIEVKFDPLKTLQSIEKNKVTFAWLAPTMWELIFSIPEQTRKDIDLDSWRVGISGTAPLRIWTKEKILQELCPNLWEVYSASELGAICAINHRYEKAKSGSVGKPALGSKIKILNENGDEVNVGETGIIYVDTPFIFKEYYKNPEETMRVRKNEYFTVEDMATQDEDGYIYIVGRKKDMIISGGQNIYPNDIEEVLVEHPKVKEASIIGVPDPIWGEAIKAYIVLNENTQLSEEDIIEYCKTKLASYKKPKFVEFLQDLPKNAVGKVLKGVLREMSSPKVHQQFKSD